MREIPSLILVKVADRPLCLLIITSNSLVALCNLFVHLLIQNQSLYIYIYMKLEMSESRFFDSESNLILLSNTNRIRIESNRFGSESNLEVDCVF